MPITKEKKEQILGELKEQTKDSDIVVFVNFHGLNTADTQDLRCSVRDSDAKYLVAKKTLIKKALNDFGFTGEMPELEGEVALVFGKGEVNLPAKAISKFGKEHEGINILGGVFNNSFVGKSEIITLAELPSRETLIAQFVNIINAPRVGLVGALSGVQRKFVGVLQQIADKK